VIICRQLSGSRRKQNFSGSDAIYYAQAIKRIKMVLEILFIFVVPNGGFYVEKE
jgi:hypothetical protein